MDSDQYEEFCRLFIASKEGLSIDKVESARLPNPQRPGLAQYKHQIDLCWDTHTEIADYFNIANAKWRTSRKISQSDVMLLQKVREKVGAHKAFLISNVGFTSGAIAAAQDEKIGLHTVVPEFDPSTLPRKNRKAIRSELEKKVSSSSAPIFSHTVVQRGLDFTGQSRQPDRSRPPSHVVSPRTTAVTPKPQNRALTQAQTRTGQSLSHTTRTFRPERKG